MTTTAEVRAGLAYAASCCGREVHAYQQDSVVSGSGYVARREFDPRLVFSQAKAAYLFTIVFFFNRAADRSSQKNIDALCEIAGPESLIAAVQDGDNWDVTVDHAVVTRVGDVGVAEQDGVMFLTVDFDIEVVW